MPKEVSDSLEPGSPPLPARGRNVWPGQRAQLVQSLVSLPAILSVGHPPLAKCPEVCPQVSGGRQVGKGEGAAGSVSSAPSTGSPKSCSGPRKGETGLGHAEALEAR